MENQSNRQYRVNGRKAQEMRHEKKRRKRKRIRVLIVAGIIILLSGMVFLGCFIVRDRGKQDQNSEEIGTLENIYDQIEDKPEKNVFNENDLNLEDLEKLIVQAEDIELDDYEQTTADKLKQRIEEAKAVVDSQEADMDINTIGIAYMHLTVAMNALTPVQ